MGSVFGIEFILLVHVASFDLRASSNARTYRGHVPAGVRVGVFRTYGQRLDRDRDGHGSIFRSVPSVDAQSLQ